MLKKILKRARAVPESERSELEGECLALVEALERIEEIAIEHEQMYHNFPDAKITSNRVSINIAQEALEKIK